VTSDSGDYGVILPFDPKRSAVEVKACDHSFEYAAVPAQPLVANVAYDIAIPSNQLNVVVMEDMSTKPVGGAVVRCRSFELVANGEKKYSGGQRGIADEKGVAHFATLNHRQPMECCSGGSGFRGNCTAEFQLTADEEKRVTLKLSREGVYRGSVTPGDIWDVAVIYFVTPAGEISETIRIEPGGHFFFTKPHTPPEYIVIASTNQPLFVIESWSGAPEGGITVNAPVSAPVLGFRVHVRGSEVQRPVGLNIGGHHIPQPAFDLHLRNQARTLPFVKSATPLDVPRIALTGPITVALGPPLSGVAGAAQTDVFIRPEYARAVQRIPLPPNAREISFE
jgi:hypothetical protein